MVGLVDPSPALLRSEPRDPEAWAMTAAGSWCVVIDNVSRIPGWWSDAICKAVTGDGWVKRKLYTDSDLAVLTFKRCVVLTSIDAGALRGDLSDRLMLVDLERIDEANRRTEDEIDRLYADARPRLLAGLLSAAQRTLAALTHVTLDTMPRMADFARILAALDQACPELTGGRAFNLFVGQRDRIAGDVVDADPVAAAVAQLIDKCGTWTGSTTDLLDALTPRSDDGKPRPPRNWPRTARGLASHLRRVVTALLVVGIKVIIPASRTRDGRIIQIERVCIEPSQQSQPSHNRDTTAPGTQMEVTVDPPTVTHDPQPSHQPSHQNPRSSPPDDDCDGSDGSDGLLPPSSDHLKVRI